MGTAFEPTRDASTDRTPPTDEPWSAAVYKPGRDRDLLVETLGKRYEVETTTDVETLDTDFGCRIFDYSQFNRVAGTVQSRRDTSEPVFLPFVLLIGEDTSDTATVDAREYVDDVIERPAKKADLLSRIGNLVERRRTAVELAEREAQLEQTVSDLKLKDRAMGCVDSDTTTTTTDRTER